MKSTKALTLDSSLQHQTHLLLPLISPKLDRSLLASGASSWELSSAIWMKTAIGIHPPHVFSVSFEPDLASWYC